MDIPSFLFGDTQPDAEWRTWAPSAIAMLEEGTVVQRALFESTGSYAIMRPPVRSDKRLNVRFRHQNTVPGFNLVILEHLDGEQRAIQLTHDLGMPEGSFRIGEMESESAFRGRLQYIAGILRSLLAMEALPCELARFSDDAATIIRMFHSAEDRSPNDPTALADDRRLHMRSGPTRILFTAKTGSTQSEIQMRYPRNCQMGEVLPVLVSARVFDAGLTTTFEPTLMSARGSISPIDAMAAIANMKNLSA